MSSNKSTVTSSKLKFENSLALSPENNHLKDVVNLLEEAIKENEQKIQIKEIVEMYNSSTEQKVKYEAKNLVLELFTRFNSKKVLKKYLQAIIGKFNLTSVIIQTTAEEISNNIENLKTCNIKQCINLLNFVAVMQNSPTFQYEETIECLFPVHFMIFEGFVYHLRYNWEEISKICDDLFTLMNGVLKHILTIFVKNIPYLEFVSNKYSTKLAVLAYTVMSHEKVGFDLKTKSGLIFTHSLEIIPEIHRNNFKYENCPSLQLLKDYNEEQYFNLLDDKLSVSDSIDTAVIIYSSILSILPQRKLVEVKINDETLICLVYNGLMECAKRKTAVPHVIVEISRTLSVIGKQLKALQSDLIKPLFLSGISFVWSHIEHFVDTVRNYARLFFVELVMVAAYHRTNGYHELAEMLVENIKRLAQTQSIRFLGFENIALHIGCVFLMENFENLPDHLLTFISETTISDQVCKAYTTIMEKHFEDIENDEWILTWVMPVTKVLKSCAHCAPVCQRIFTVAFQRYPAVLRTIFPNDYLGNTQESAVLLKCLQYARNNGVELTIDKSNNGHLYWRGLIDKDKMEKFMVHQNDEVRILALASIVESQKTTEIYLDWELNYLTLYLHYNITSQIPNIRKQTLTYYKKALARYNAGFHVIVRNIGTLTKDLEVIQDRRETVTILRVFQELRNSYKRFLRKLTRQLISYLTFDSNFSRRATSLELLIMIQSLLTKEEWLNCWTDEDVKNCHSILFDGYESNKKMAVILLRNLPSSYIGFTNVDFTFKYMQRCLNIALAIKPSKTVSAAYLLEICAFSPYFYDIVQYGEGQAEVRRTYHPILDMIVVLTGKLITQSNMQVECGNPKVANYGIILSIRYLLQSRDLSRYNDAYSGLFEHITKFCLNLKDSIMPIVCNPSPEGYLPDSSEMLCDSDYCPKTQLIMVCAWRTIKEMTLLLAEIIRQTIKLENTFEMLGESFMVQIGEFFIDIFIESKHRGVFEQAYVGFSVICESFWLSSNPKLNCLPKLWLKDALDLCVGQKQSDKLCATRRSAGLPFLILSILSSEPTFSKPRFYEAINLLLVTCENTDPSNNEHRMHCLNVLRAMFRHSRTGEIVAPYIGIGVIAAIKGFKSDTWGIRNSATLLYAALITRMFGVQRTNDSEDVCLKNRLTVRVFYLRYPELFQFISETLAEECNKDDSLVLHPVLMILARLYPSHMEECNDQLLQYLPHLTTCLSNPMYKTRELAARASVALIQTDQVPNHLETSFIRMKEDIRDNECHGLLLKIWHLLKANSLTEIPLTSYLENSIHLLQNVGRKFSHMTVTLYMEVITMILIKFRGYEDLHMLKSIVAMLSKQIAQNYFPITSLSKYPQTRLLLIIFIVVNKFEETDITYSTITNQIMCQLYGHDQEMKRFCLNLLIYLNQALNEPNSKHALYQTGDMQIPQEIITIIDTLDKSSVTKILKNIHQYLKCFLIEEIKYQHYIKKEDQVLLFLLVNYYPCVVKYLYLSKQATLNMLLDYCLCDNEELISAVISCISTFLLQLDYNVLCYKRLVEHLVMSASPAVSDYRRLAVCDFLVKNYILYCNEERILVGDDLPMVLSIVMVLLEDDELVVRNAMSEFATALKIRIILNNKPRQTLSGQRLPIIPEKAREDLLNLASILLQKQGAICFLFSWACRHFPDQTNDANETLFDKSELNLYAENVPFVDFCTKLLHSHLWPLVDGLNYGDKSIFIEEHTLLVTTVLLDSLEKHPSPMMVYKTKLSVICALKSTVKFVERFPINNNFPYEFRKYLNEKILGYLTRHVDHPDFFSVKKILKNVYEPVLNYRR